MSATQEVSTTATGCPLGFESSNADLPDVIDVRTGVGLPRRTFETLQPLDIALTPAQAQISAVTALAVTSFTLAVKGEPASAFPVRFVRGFFQDLTRATLKSLLQMAAIAATPVWVASALTRDVAREALELAARMSRPAAAALIVPLTVPAITLGHSASCLAAQIFDFADTRIRVSVLQGRKRPELRETRAPRAGFSTITRSNAEIVGLNARLDKQIAALEAHHGERIYLNSLASLVAVLAGSVAAGVGTLAAPGSGTSIALFVGESLPYFVI